MPTFVSPLPHRNIKDDPNVLAVCHYQRTPDDKKRQLPVMWFRTQPDKTEQTWIIEDSTFENDIRLYWNKRSGWTEDVRSATKFTEKEKAQDNRPKGNMPTWIKTPGWLQNQPETGNVMIDPPETGNVMIEGKMVNNVTRSWFNKQFTLFCNQLALSHRSTVYSHSDRVILFDIDETVFRVQVITAGHTNRHNGFNYDTISMSRYYLKVEPERPPLKEGGIYTETTRKLLNAIEDYLHEYLNMPYEDDTPSHYAHSPTGMNFSTIHTNVVNGRIMFKHIVMVDV